MGRPILQKITIYPIKSLSGQSLQEAVISEGGCLLHDREFTIIDGNGDYVNGKSNPLVHRLHSSVDFDKKIELALYRTAQELVNNALKHAKASVISIQLQVRNNFRFFLVS